MSEVASEGKAAFRKLIQNERRIEFAFEDHRFWDLRRCLLPLDTTIEGIQVTRTDNGLSYEIKEIEQRPLDALRYYYLPLPNDELLKNPNLKNNMGGIITNIIYDYENCKNNIACFDDLFNVLL